MTATQDLNEPQRRAPQRDLVDGRLAVEAATGSMRLIGDYQRRGSFLMALAQTGRQTRAELLPRIDALLAEIHTQQAAMADRAAGLPEAARRHARFQNVLQALASAEDLARRAKAALPA